MKNNFILQIIIIFLIGYVLAYYVYDKYKTNVVINEVDKVYFLQEGVYLIDKNININVPYIKVKDNSKYYTYLGMTLDKKQANNIKKMYEKENINVYIKEMEVKNMTFISELAQYDILLSQTSNYKEIISILDTILSTYQEIIEE